MMVAEDQDLHGKGNWEGAYIEQYAEGYERALQRLVQDEHSEAL